MSEHGILSKIRARLAEMNGCRIWSLVLLIVGVIYGLSFCAGLGGDSPLYVMYAQAIATGQGYRDINLPDSPPAAHSPPGFPLVLAFVYYLFPHFPDNLPALQCVPLLSALGLVPLLYGYFYKREENVWQAGGLTLLTMIVPLTIVFSVLGIMTEVPYFFFSILSLLLLENSLQAKENRLKSYTFLSMAILSMGATYYVRVTGLALIAAAAVYFICTRQWKRAVLTLGGFLFLVFPWLLRNYLQGIPLFGDYGSNYFRWRDFERPYLGTVGPGDLVVRLLNNMRGHATEAILWLFFPWAINGWWPAFLSRVHLESLTWVSPGLGLTVSALCVLGYIVSLRKRLRVDHLYVVFYLGIILLPPWYVERNLWPLLPFLLYYFVIGLRWLVERASPLWRKSVSLAAPVTVVAFCIILFGFAMSDRHLLAVGAAYRAGEIDESERVFGELCEWIGDNTSPDDLLLYRYPDKLYLYTGRKVIGIPMIIDHDAFLSKLNHAGVDYVVLEPHRQQWYEYGWNDQIYLQPAVTAYPQAFVPVHQIGADPDYPALVVYRLAEASVLSGGQ